MHLPAIYSGSPTYALPRPTENIYPRPNDFAYAAGRFIEIPEGQSTIHRAPGAPLRHNRATTDEATQDSIRADIPADREL